MRSAPDRLLLSVAEVFGTSPAEICGPSRTQHVVLARQAAIYLMRSIWGWSLPAIGHSIGRTHSTVLYSIRQAQAHLQDNARFRAQLAQVITQHGT